MLLPSRVTSPVAVAPGTTSCIRLRHRTSVDLPHPDGPMIAAIWFSSNDRLTSLSARFLLKYALSFLTTSFSAMTTLALSRPHPSPIARPVRVRELFPSAPARPPTPAAASRQTARLHRCRPEQSAC